MYLLPSHFYIFKDKTAFVQLYVFLKQLLVFSSSVLIQLSFYDMLKYFFFYGGSQFLQGEESMKSSGK